MTEKVYTHFTLLVKPLGRRIAFRYNRDVIYAFFGYAFSGAALGITAGISPGPLLTLVIKQTLQFNWKAGIACALAPVATDTLIILTSVFLFSKFAESHVILGIVTFIGALFLAFLAYESFTVKGIAIDTASSGKSAGTGANPITESFLKGIITNILSPSPYLFWMAVGSPAIIEALKISPLCCAAFLGSFYSLLTGSKIAAAFIVSRTRDFINQKIYVIIIRILGGVLCAFAVYYIIKGLSLFGIKLFP